MFAKCHHKNWYIHPWYSNNVQVCSGTDVIEVNLISQQHLSYYIPFPNQSFPDSLCSTLAFLDN